MLIIDTVMNKICSLIIDKKITRSNSAQNQAIVKSNFKNNMKKYYSDMVDNGIPEKDVKNTISHSNDESIRNSFISKYTIELLGITVSVAGMATTLYDILK